MNKFIDGTTDEKLFYKIVEKNDYRFTASRANGDHGKYNDASKNMMRDGGIEMTSNGKTISKRCECLDHRCG